MRKHALNVLGEMKKIPGLRDVQLYQQLDYPTVQRGHRPREGGPQRRVGQGRHQRAVGGHFFQPLRGQELLARSAHRGRLPGPGPGPLQRMNRPAADGDPAPEKGQRPEQPDGPRRGQRADRHGARRDRPQFHAALPEHHGQRRGRGPGPGIGSNRPGHRRCRRAAARRAGQRPRPGRAHDGDVPVAGDRPGPVGRGDPGHVDRLLPVVPAGTGLDRRRAGRGLRRGHHPA